MRALRIAPRRPRVAGWIVRPLSRRHPGFAALAASFVVFAILVVSGALDQLQATLGAIGFDPDRARLLVALVACAMVASVAGFASRAWAWGVLVSIAASLACFGPTFANETRLALVSQAHDFDAAGWAVAAFTLLAAATLVGWITATLAIHGRSALDRLVATMAAARTDRTRRSQAGRALVQAIAVILSLLVGVPVFGDMVNLAPDAAMHRGSVAAQRVGTSTTWIGGATGPPAGGPPSVPPATLDPSMVAGPLAGSAVTAGAISSAAPWSTHPPAGTGRVVTTSFPAPWVGGVLPTAPVDVYLPPGYEVTSARRYPVVYSAPIGMATWDKGAGIRGLLDRLITAGALPPVIFVFASHFGALYPSSECADSFDGRQWFERYMVQTIVPYVDATYRTVAGPAGRSLLGFSEGGYCAASLLVRHPDVFGQAAALSGYYHAGLRSAATPTAWRVFGGNAARTAAASPTLVVGTLPASARESLFIVLMSQPDDPLFGAEYIEFSAALTGAGVAHATIPIREVGHSWPAVRATLEPVLRLLVARQVRMGVTF